MIRAVLFDLDGVLVDSELTNLRAAILGMGEQGVILSESDKKLVAGRNPVDYCVDFAKKYVFNRDLFIKRHRFFHARFYSKTKAFKGARNLILFCKKNFKVGLVSSSRLSIIRRALRILRLSVSDFDVLVSFENCKVRKPSPIPYLSAAKLLKVKPSECVVVEDSVVGVLSARRANMLCIGVTNTFSKSKLSKANFVVGNLKEVEFLLR